MEIAYEHGAITFDELDGPRYGFRWEGETGVVLRGLLAQELGKYFFNGESSRTWGRHARFVPDTPILP